MGGIIYNPLYRLLLLDHIIPPIPSSTSSSSSSDMEKAKAEKSIDNDSRLSWDHLDAIVKKWIYSTISNNLLLTAIKPKATAKEAWDDITHLFQDNQASRAIALKTRLNNTKLDSFSSISAYCQELKVLADQLANGKAPIFYADLLLQMVTGLANTEYDVIGMFIS
ncbi:uncharacterized protein LOC143621952 [Bidens hawaiensis]|uniref:uncharacterized protein LOC143621952 n=1 Tax=Bidens hawaiensis TaxID=980011 RepID=UPI004049212B